MRVIEDFQDLLDELYKIKIPTIIATSKKTRGFFLLFIFFSIALVGVPLVLMLFALTDLWTLAIIVAFLLIAYCFSVFASKSVNKEKKHIKILSDKQVEYKENVKKALAGLLEKEDKSILPYDAEFLRDKIISEKTKNEKKEGTFWSTWAPSFLASIMAIITLLANPNDKTSDITATIQLITGGLITIICIACYLHKEWRNTKCEKHLICLDYADYALSEMIYAEKNNSQNQTIES